MNHADMTPESLRASTPIALILTGGAIAIATLVLAGMGKLSDVSITAAQAINRMTLVLRITSDINPAGLSNKINGTNIMALTMAVNKICWGPS